jgi:diguanylate cyclase (GGDEF)-like protein
LHNRYTLISYVTGSRDNYYILSLSKANTQYDFIESDAINRLVSKKIVLLDDTDIDGAAKVAEKVRAAAEESVCLYEGTSMNATLSFGCCVVDPARTAEENIAVADRRLYTAKESGRNRVVKEG